MNLSTTGRPNWNAYGDLFFLKNGYLLSAWTSLTSRGDADDGAIDGRISQDGGKTWGSVFRVLAKEPTDVNLMLPSFLRMDNGDLGIFYLRKYKKTDGRVYSQIYLRRSAVEDGKNWDSASCVTCGPDGYYTINNSRVIRLKSGRILVPVAYTATFDTYRDLTDYVYYSDDDGRTWTRSTPTSLAPGVGTQEPGLVELENGQVLMNIRVTPTSLEYGGYIYTARSSDRGQTWSPLERSPLTSPCSSSTVVRVPGQNILIMFWNNVKATDGTPRTPLSSAFSPDEGKTWQNFKNLEDAPASSGAQFAYVSATFDKRRVYLTYYQNSGFLKFRVLELDWFLLP